MAGEMSRACHPTFCRCVDCLHDRYWPDFRMGEVEEGLDDWGEVDEAWLNDPWDDDEDEDDSTDDADFDDEAI